MSQSRVRPAISVPTGRGKLKVTCARCKTQWDWSPVEGQPDIRELPFRCALNGARFRVVFGRQDASHRYRVVHVYSAVDGSFPVVAAASGSRFLGRLLAPFRGGRRHKGTELTALPATQNFEARQFDFGGWYCPCCGLSRDVPSHPQFVRCGTCGECVCCARLIRVSPGIETFACHDGCKGGGRITGHIESFDASPLHASTEAAELLNRSQPGSTAKIENSDSAKRIRRQTGRVLAVRINHPAFIYSPSVCWRALNSRSHCCSFLRSSIAWSWCWYASVTDKPVQGIASSISNSSVNKDCFKWGGKV